MVIILNGAGSSGKSTIAQRLMAEIKEPTIYHNFDFLIPTLLPHRDSFESALDPMNRTYVRRLDEDLYKKMHDGSLSLLPLIYEFIVPLHVGGFNVIVDTLLPGKCIVPLFTILNEIDTFFVGIRCPIEELRRRELQRKDRKLGNAERTSKKVHKNRIYDIEVDTSELDVERCVARIADHISKTKPVAFRKMKELYEKDEINSQDE